MLAQIQYLPTVILTASILTGCQTAADPKTSLKNYLQACHDGRPADAYLLDKQPQSCPPQEITRTLLKQLPDFEIVARDSNGDFVWIDRGNGQFSILDAWVFDDNSLKFQFAKLRYALLTRDGAALATLFAPGGASAQAMQAWIDSNASRVNALYAAMATISTPWFKITGNTALCDVAGYWVTFQVHDGRWYVSDLGLK